MPAGVGYATAPRAQTAAPTQSIQQQLERMNARWGAFDHELSTWRPTWQQVAEFMLPRATRFLVSDRNKGQRKDQNIINNTATLALEQLAAGLMSIASSPARLWFDIETEDPDLNEFHSVQLWRSQVVQRIDRMFQRSNVYRALPTMYEDLAAFGTSAAVMLPDRETRMHVYTVPLGEYGLAQDFRTRVNVLYRKFEVTVASLVREFGEMAVSKMVREQWRRGGASLERPVTVMHVIEPREDRDSRFVDAENMAFRSTYFECAGGEHRFLRDSGFEKFPALTPRWKVRSGDTYGSSCPGLNALGDTRGLQQKELRLAQGLDFNTLRPVTAPTQLKERDLNMRPGGVTFSDSANPTGPIRPIFDHIPLGDMHVDIARDEVRIERALKGDLFRAITDIEKQMTAFEAAKRYEEKLVQLGPVAENVHNEQLGPLVEFGYSVLLERGELPPPPPEVEEANLQVRFVSMLAQAQRAVGANGLDRFVMTVKALGEVREDVVDKFNADGALDEYRSMLGVNPKLVHPDEQVRGVREARGRAVAETEASEVAATQAAAARNIAAGAAVAPDVMQQLTGYSTRVA